MVPDIRCFQWLKVTKMKANHNHYQSYESETEAVSNGSKLLKWKQITTKIVSFIQEYSLFPMAQSY